VAILGIAGLGYLAVENWTFGFERIVELRLKPVSAASRELSNADAALAALQNRRQQSSKSNAQKRDELRLGADRRDASIAQLTAQLGIEAQTHQNNLEEIREACRIIRESCMVPRSQAEDRRYGAEVSRLGTELAGQREERKQLQSQIDELVTKDANDAASLDQGIGLAVSAVNGARQSLRNAADGNQIYRLAASWYGVGTSNVTSEQLAVARLVFATFSAVAVAVAGSVAALVYYAPSREPGTPSCFGAAWGKTTRACRAYFARKRRPLVREVPGPEVVRYRAGKEPPIVVEKEVLRFIDRIVLIPRWGISVPMYINSLIREQRPSIHPTGDDPADVTSNVMQLGRKAK